MKTIIAIIMTLLCVSCAATQNQPVKPEQLKQDFSDYRYFPFQWVYPEYYYKADIIKVSPNKNFSPNKYERINFFGLSTLVRKEHIGELKKDDNRAITYTSPSEKGAFVLALYNKKDLLCSEKAKEKERDYCTAFGSAQEYYHKLFTLTPDILKEDASHSIGNYWFVHIKGKFFEDTEKIRIYEGNNFVAYVREFKKGSRKGLNSEVTIFHKNLPLGKYIGLGIRLSDKNFVPDFLSSLK